jgi:sulfite exporter TauE/SafE
MSFLTPFLIGLFSSLHCLAMCSALCGVFCQNRSSTASIWALNLGRIFTYTLTGILVAGLVQGLLLQIPLAQIGFWVRSVLGLVLVLIGMSIFFDSKWGQNILSSSPLWNRVKIALFKLDAKQSISFDFLKGMLWGLIPCGLLYGVLMAAATTADVIDGGLFMFMFGLGTLPSMILSGQIMQQWKSSVIQSGVKKFVGLFIILIGLWAAISPWVSSELIPDHPVFTPLLAFLNSCLP